MPLCGFHWHSMLVSIILDYVYCAWRQGFPVLTWSNWLFCVSVFLKEPLWILIIVKILETGLLIWMLVREGCHHRLVSSVVSLNLLVCMNVLAFQFSGGKEQRSQGVKPGCGLEWMLECRKYFFQIHWSSLSVAFVWMCLFCSIFVLCRSQWESKPFSNILMLIFSFTPILPDFVQNVSFYLL